MFIVWGYMLILLLDIKVDIYKGNYNEGLIFWKIVYRGFVGCRD